MTLFWATVIGLGLWLLAALFPRASSSSSGDTHEAETKLSKIHLKGDGK